MSVKRSVRLGVIILWVLIGLCALYIFSFKGGVDGVGFAIKHAEKCNKLTPSLLEKLWNSKTTKLPRLECSEIKPMISVSVSMIDGECGGGPMWHNPVCSSCDDPKTLFTLKSECDKCPNRIFKPEHYSSGKCILKQ